MNIYTIYKSTSKTSTKSYIGYTYDFNQRLIVHKSNAFNLLQQQSYNKHFYRAIRKYGWDDFTWEIIYQSLDQEHAREMETYFIRFYDTFRHGYNSTLGGEGGFLIDISIEQIVQDYKSTDLTLSQIATKNKCSLDVVMTRLKAGNVVHPKNCQKRNLIDEDIITDYQNGIGSPEIARKYQVTPGTILNRLKKNGIKIRDYYSASVNATYPDRTFIRNKMGRFIKEKINT